MTCFEKQSTNKFTVEPSPKTNELRHIWGAMKLEVFKEQLTLLSKSDFEGEKVSLLRQGFCFFLLQYCYLCNHHEAVRGVKYFKKIPYNYQVLSEDDEVCTAGNSRY